MVKSWTEIGRLAPGLALLRHYRRGWLRADVLAGVTVAAYLIPQAIVMVSRRPVSA